MEKEEMTEEEIIKIYIQFAIDNWLIANMVWKYEKVLEIDIWQKQTYISLQEKPWFTMSETFNNIELITNSIFIKTIAFWLKDKVLFQWYTWWCSCFRVNNFEFIICSKNAKNDDILKELEYKITIRQAIAIRDKQLKNYINNLIK